VDWRLGVEPNCWDTLGQEPAQVGNVVQDIGHVDRSRAGIREWQSLGVRHQVDVSATQDLGRDG
jgi:hypothetical protein